MGGRERSSVRGAAGVVVPKAEEPALLHRIDGALGVLELARGGERGATGIVPLIESALGVLSTYELCRSSPRVRSVLFGSRRRGRRADGGGVHDCPEPLQAVRAVDALVDALDVPVTVRSLAYRHRALLTVGQEAVVKARAVAERRRASGDLRGVDGARR